MGLKNIVATLYLKGGQAVKSADDHTVIGDVFKICQLFNDSGIDKIIIFKNTLFLIFLQMIMSMKEMFIQLKILTEILKLKYVLVVI